MRVSVSRALSGAAAALVCATALVAAPAAEAVQLRPAAVSASLDCTAVGGIRGGAGLITCSTSLSGVAPFSVSWSASAAIVSATTYEADLHCWGNGSPVSVTATVTDATGSVTTASQSLNCYTGVPI